MKRFTITDVATLAGVSPTTVSFVLNRTGNSSIPESTRQRVLAAAAELNYRPSAAARALVTRQTMTIGLLSDEIASGTYAVGTIQGAQDAAWKRDRLMLVVNTGGDSELEKRAVGLLIDRQVDGIVYASYTTREVDPPAELATVPSVLVNCLTADRRFRSLLPDEFGAAQACTHSLLELGHRDIAFINGPLDYWAAAERLRGYESALKEFDVEPKPNLKKTGDWWPETAYELTRELVDSAAPTAILCGNDRMALGCYDALRERGLVVPDDVSVLGFDNQEFAAHMRPAIGSVRLPDYEMAERAVELLVESAGPVPAGTDYFPCELILRQSHGPAAGRRR